MALKKSSCCYRCLASGMFTMKAEIGNSTTPVVGDRDFGWFWFTMEERVGSTSS